MAGRSQSPAVPKKLLSGGSPEYSDVALMDARADEQRPADCPHPKGDKGDGAAPCMNKCRAQLYLYRMPGGMAFVK